MLARLLAAAQEAGISIGRSRWIPRSLVRISTPPTSPVTQGAGSNYKNPAIEPPDHGIGRSRGGLTSKIHHLVDGAGRPLVVLVSAGQAHDGPRVEHLLAHLKVARGTAAAPRSVPTGFAVTKPIRAERPARSCAAAASLL